MNCIEYMTTVKSKNSTIQLMDLEIGDVVYLSRQSYEKGKVVQVKKVDVNKLLIHLEIEVKIHFFTDFYYCWLTKFNWYDPILFWIRKNWYSFWRFIFNRKY